ncbi:MAG: hypothetical protein J5511_00365 [Bacilli bacterium]|nr:hypothetical protein [Bacilli bacterium]
MKLSMVKKFNVIISLWLVVIMLVLAIFGHELDMYGFYIASAVIGGFAVVSNVGVLISGLILPSIHQKRVSKEYN